MTELLEMAVAATRNLPPELQDDVARLMLAYAGEREGVYVLTREEEEDLEAALAEVERGELASEAEVEAVFSKYRL